MSAATATTSRRKQRPTTPPLFVVSPSLDTDTPPKVKKPRGPRGPYGNAHEKLVEEADQPQDRQSQPPLWYQEQMEQLRIAEQSDLQSAYAQAYAHMASILPFPTPTVTPQQKRTSASIDDDTTSDSYAGCDALLNHDDPLALYRPAIRTHPLLTAARERQLARWIGQAETNPRRAWDAREELLLSNIGIAYRLAKWYSTVHAPLRDLLDVALISIWRHAARFNPEAYPEAGRFTTFIYPTLRRDLRRAVLEYTNVIHRPMGVIEVERRITRFVDGYVIEHGHEPSLDLLSAALDTAPDETHAVLDQLATRPRVVSLEKEFTQQANHANHSWEDQGQSWLDLLADENPEHDPVWMAEQQEVAETVGTALDTLTAKQREVLLLYYGEDEQFTGNMAAIGREMGITREAVRQLYGKGIRALKRHDKATGALRTLYSSLHD